MPVHRRLLHALAAAALLTASACLTPAQAQTNPPLRIVVPYPPGGGSDRAARIVAEALQPRLGTPVVVENISGAGGRLALRQLAAQGDGSGSAAGSQLLVLVNPALMVVAPAVYKNNGYEPERDFQPVAQISSYEFAAAVGPAVPVRELGHLMAWIKANPDKANLGVPASGSLPHFFALMWAQQAGAKLEVVGYRGSAPLTTDLIGGHVPVAVDSLETLLPLHEAGKLRILATSGPTRAVKSIPTFMESGSKFSALGWNVFYAKAGMPAATADKLAREIAAVMALPELREKFLQAKVDPVSADRAATQRMLVAFKAQWQPVIQKAGLSFE